MAQRIDFSAQTNLGAVADPINVQDVATKNYVDTRPSGPATLQGLGDVQITDPSYAQVGTFTVTMVGSNSVTFNGSIVGFINVGDYLRGGTSLPSQLPSIQVIGIIPGGASIEFATNPASYFAVGDNVYRLPSALDGTYLAFSNAQNKWIADQINFELPLDGITWTTRSGGLYTSSTTIPIATTFITTNIGNLGNDWTFSTATVGNLVSGAEVAVIDRFGRFASGIYLNATDSGGSTATLSALIYDRIAGGGWQLNTTYIVSVRQGVSALINYQNTLTTPTVTGIALISAINSGTSMGTVAGDQTTTLTMGRIIRFVNDPNGPVNYIILQAPVFSGGNTTFSISPNVAQNVPSGSIIETVTITNWVNVEGPNLTAANNTLQTANPTLQQVTAAGNTTTTTVTVAGITDSAQPVTSAINYTNSHADVKVDGTTITKNVTTGVLSAAVTPASYPTLTEPSWRTVTGSGTSAITVADNSQPAISFFAGLNFIQLQLTWTVDTRTYIATSAGGLALTVTDIIGLQNLDQSQVPFAVGEGFPAVFLRLINLTIISPNRWHIAGNGWNAGFTQFNLSYTGTISPFGASPNFFLQSSNSWSGGSSIIQSSTNYVAQVSGSPQFRTITPDDILPAISGTPTDGQVVTWNALANTSRWVTPHAGTVTSVSFASPASNAFAINNPSTTPTIAFQNVGGTATNVYLRGDGTWSTPPSSTGTVTSVGMTVPTGFSIGGSPITSSGTLALTYSGLIPTSSLGTGTASSANFLRGDGAWATPPTSTGTVTSVALSMPAEFTVAGSPITSSGTFTVTKNNETVNSFYAGPSTGSAAQPTFRAMAKADVIAVATTGIRADANTYVVGDVTFAAGTNITLGQSGNVITINSAGGGGGMFITDAVWAGTNTASKDAYTSPGVINSQGINIGFVASSGSGQITNATIRLNSVALTNTYTSTGTWPNLTISIPVADLSGNAAETAATVAIAVTGTFSGGNFNIASVGMLTNVQPVPFTTTLSGSYILASAPFYATTTTLNYVYSNASNVTTPNGTFSFMGGLSQLANMTSGSFTGVPLSGATITGSATGNGTNGAGSLTVTLTGSVPAVPLYTPAFYAQTANSTPPTFTISSMQTAGAAVGSTITYPLATASTQYNWICTQRPLANIMVVTPFGTSPLVADVTAPTQTISGQVFNVFGITALSTTNAVQLVIS